MVVLEGKKPRHFSIYFFSCLYSRTESVVETLIQYFVGTGLMTRFAMFHWTVNGAVTFFLIVFLPLCVLPWWLFHPSMLLFSYTYYHFPVCYPAKYTSLSRDGIFNDAMSVYAVLPIFLSGWLVFVCCHAVYANSILALYDFPRCHLPWCIYLPGFLPRFNARRQLREKLHESLELKLPTNILFGEPESMTQNLLKHSDPFCASAETKYSECACSTRGVHYWQVNDNLITTDIFTAGHKDKDPSHGMQSRNYTV
jgi:hypothetical protein